ncbi:hypothetical protein TNCV_1255341 [Trichonephila clavipes]|nr:hypothetical protein TNCV_1255341 [Trichonephila clavipes]
MRAFLGGMDEVHREISSGRFTLGVMVIPFCTAKISSYRNKERLLSFGVPVIESTEDAHVFLQLNSFTHDHWRSKSPEWTLYRRFLGGSLLGLLIVQEFLLTRVGSKVAWGPRIINTAVATPLLIIEILH